MPQQKLQRYLGLLIEKGIFHSHNDIADVCGMTRDLLSHVLNAPERRLSVEQCLRLALEIREHPPAVLRVAGREDAADVLEEVWPRKRGHITRSEQDLVDRWRQLTLKARHHLGGLIAIHAERGSADSDGPLARARGGKRVSTQPPPRGGRR
jgi:hypothetical protein